MADEAITTQDTEVKDVEGTVAAEITKELEVAPKEHSKPAAETVPLAVYLELKDDMKSLKQEIKESKSSQRDDVEVRGVSDLATKYPDVNEEFIKDMLSSATREATKKIEEKYTPIIERQEKEKKQIAFDKAFDVLLEKALKENPDMPQTIDRELIKEIAITPKYRNVPVADILLKMYANVPVGKGSSEDEMRSGADRVEDVVSFDNITESQRALVMADPKARAKFFDYLDNHAGR